MNSIICTLFEGHYHYGVAALANSLYKQGYQGEIYVGYKGSLPPWAVWAKKNYSLNWQGATTLRVAEGLQLHFLPLNTHYHLTNYKPEFMLRLLDGPAKDSDAIAYFDPDIIIKCKWKFYETWMNYGVALVHEIISNDMPQTHPIRLEWEKFSEKISEQPVRKLKSYINAGFCGVARKNIEFLVIWREVIKKAIEEFKPDPRKFMSFDRTYPFFSIDQDALNVTAMCAKSPISEIGPEGMDFIHGGWTMSHAVGVPKPWRKKFIWSALKGYSPSLADSAYWSNVGQDSPITSYTKLHVKVKRISILVASLISRFYHRN